jgi:hypothetical protein
VSRFAAPLAAFVAMTVVVLATGAVLFARKIGFAASRVQAAYLGSEATFAEPRSLAGMLEVAVPHLLAVPLVVFVTLHLAAFATRPGRRAFSWAAGVTYGCAFLGIAAGFGIRFLWPGLAPLKVAAFVGLEATLLAWVGLVAVAAIPRAPAATQAGDVRDAADAPSRAAR